MAVEVLHKTISQLSGNLCRFWFGFSCTCNQINGASAILGLKYGPWSASGSTSSLYKKLLLLLKAEGNFKKSLGKLFVRSTKNQKPTTKFLSFDSFAVVVATQKENRPDCSSFFKFQP